MGWRTWCMWTLVGEEGGVNLHLGCPPVARTPKESSSDRTCPGQPGQCSLRTRPRRPRAPGTLRNGVERVEAAADMSGGKGGRLRSRDCIFIPILNDVMWSCRETSTGWERRGTHRAPEGLDAGLALLHAHRGHDLPWLGRMIKELSEKDDKRTV